jgi:hypothetical protein
VGATVLVSSSPSSPALKTGAAGATLYTMQLKDMDKVRTSFSHNHPPNSTAGLSKPATISITASRNPLYIAASLARTLTCDMLTLGLSPGWERPTAPIHRCCPPSAAPHKRL